MPLTYFGTDGIRAPITSPTLQAPFLRRLGYVLGMFWAQHMSHDSAHPFRVVVGRDTRASGQAIAQHLWEGLSCHLSWVAVQLGILPTPGIALAVTHLGAQAGIAITASHNPATDNGIKLFNHKGLKLTPEDEKAIEHLLAVHEAWAWNPHHPTPPMQALAGAIFYREQVRQAFKDLDLSGYRFVVDTANGATTETTPWVLHALGATVVGIGAHPDGQNINEGLGSEHPEVLAQEVKRQQAFAGIAHDGDGDRVVICDETGVVIPGEIVLALMTVDAQEEGCLSHQLLITTEQSNAGLDAYLCHRGIRTRRVAVGDRNILYALLETGAFLGGESSGHYVFTDWALCGDGLIAALKVLALAKKWGRPLSVLRQVFALYPQRTANVIVAQKTPLESMPVLEATIATVSATLGSQGRVLVRYSGTEPKLRLLVEGPSPVILDQMMDQLKTAVESSTCTANP